MYQFILFLFNYKNVKIILYYIYYIITATMTYLFVAAL